MVPVHDDPKGYYAALGVSREASADQIRIAYRALVRRYHPDHAQDPDAQERFRRIQEAYEVLRDPLARMAYDREARLAQTPAGKAAPGIARTPQGSLTSRRLWSISGAVALLGVLLVSAWIWSRGRNGTERPAPELPAALIPSAGPSVATPSPPSPEVTADGRVLFEASVHFAPGSFDLDDRARMELAEALSRLAVTLDGLSGVGRWLVVVETFAPRAASQAGAAFDDWGLALGRAASVIDELVAAGMPADRLAARLHAGLAPKGVQPSELADVRLALFCCASPVSDSRPRR
ncbi:Chaperone protein DnaJ [bacterium HR40]|nr:Chaperone protein DnaJ [bacterium HR40]